MHSEDPIVTASKAIVYLELQFSRMKHDVNKFFDWHLLRNGNSCNNCFPNHTIVYAPGLYQDLILPVVDLKY